MVKRVDSKRIDLTGRKFGELKVVKLSDKRGNNNTLLWECKCSCGNIIYLQGYSLIHGHYKSCGCRRTEKREAGVKEYLKNDMVDGTRKSALHAKLHKSNKSGYKGVMWDKHKNKWRAYIGFKGKQINLGYYEKKDDAIKARKQAEEKYFKPYLEDNNHE